MTPRPLLIVQSDRLSSADPAPFARVGDIADMFRRAIGDVEGAVIVVNPAVGEPLPVPETLSGAIIADAAAMAADACPLPEFDADITRNVAKAVADRQQAPLAQRLCAAAAQVCDTPAAAALIHRFAQIAFAAGAAATRSVPEPVFK